MRVVVDFAETFEESTGRRTRVPIEVELEELRSSFRRMLVAQFEELLEKEYPRADRELLLDLDVIAADRQSLNDQKAYLKAVADLRIDLVNKVDEADTLAELKAIQLPTIPPRPPRLILGRNKKVRA